MALLMSEIKLIDSQLSFSQVDIVTELRIVPAQENCDGPDYDLMISAAEYITELRDSLSKANDKIHELMEGVSDQ